METVKCLLNGCSPNKDAKDARVVLKAEDLDGYLTGEDNKDINELSEMYAAAMAHSPHLDKTSNTDERALDEEGREALIASYDRMGHRIAEICAAHPRIQVYSFITEEGAHAEASRVIAKLRDKRTAHHAFVYWVQRAYEMLFRLAYTEAHTDKKNHIIVPTPITNPVQMYAVHKIPDIDSRIENSVMCVMLRGALLPSMIMSKEIEEYSSHGYVTPFALFKINRNDTKKEDNMEYILDLKRSFFDIASLDGKDLIFADPMNATGGSLVTVVKYLISCGVHPASIKFFNVISALKGALRVTRALENCTCYTMWLDPALNDSAYILPGLGDAGDRLNGVDTKDAPRNIMQLVADYGGEIAEFYRSQLRQIENTVLG